MTVFSYTPMDEDSWDTDAYENHDTDELSKYKASLLGDSSSNFMHQTGRDSAGLMESSVPESSENNSTEISSSSQKEYRSLFTHREMSTKNSLATDLKNGNISASRGWRTLATSKKTDKLRNHLGKIYFDEKKNLISSFSLRTKRKPMVSLTKTDQATESDFSAEEDDESDVPNTNPRDAQDYLLPPKQKDICKIIGSMDKKLRGIIGDVSSSSSDQISSERIYDAMLYCQNTYEQELHVYDPSPLLDAFRPFSTLSFPLVNVPGKSPQSFKESLASHLMAKPSSTNRRIQRPAFLKNQDLIGLSRNLMPHQIHGIRWLLSLYVNGLNGVLADEMGLGKSIQTAVFLNIIRIIYNTKGSHLIVCPTSMIHEWKKVFSEWCREYTIFGEASRDALKTCCSCTMGRSESTECACSCHCAFRTNTISEVSEKFVAAISQGNFTSLRGILDDIDIIIVNYDFLRQKLRPKNSDDEVRHSGYKTEAMSSYILRRMVLRRHYSYIVCDEGHRIWNQESITSKRIFKLSSQFRLVLTGTPLQNKLSELSSLVKYIIINQADTRSLQRKPKPGLSTLDRSNYKNVVEAPLKELFADITAAQQAKQTPGRNIPSQLEPLAIRLHQLLRPFILRRERWEVLRSPQHRPNMGSDSLETGSTGTNHLAYPSTDRFATHVIVRCPISDLQESLIQKKHSAKDFLTKVNEPIDPCGSLSGSSSLLVRLNHLKKISMHPYLLLREFVINEELVAASGKLAVLDEIVHKLLAEGIHRPSNAPSSEAGYSTANELRVPKAKVSDKMRITLKNPSQKRYHRKILIFCHYHAMLDLLQDWARLRYLSYRRIDGSTPAEERAKIIERYNEDYSIPILFLSKKAGGLGLNLQVADTVILFEMGSNYSLDAQVISRICRINQKKRIKIIQLLCGAGLEDQTQELSAQRRYTNEMFLDQEQLSNYTSLQDRAQKLLGQIKKSMSENDEDSKQISDEIVAISPGSTDWNIALARTADDLQNFNEIDQAKKWPRYGIQTSPTLRVSSSTRVSQTAGSDVHTNTLNTARGAGGGRIVLRPKDHFLHSSTQCKNDLS
ncbi:transcription regulatory protein SNF2 [Perkinsela sp. CCAP 1560/4]|nr:transcription regulatory protein SNF2 [Perkinsela sp. CCAP 1560/4]|eukprot:KNH05260.1 transcription regulatory protein SNF2 [Perkinsela sp. CCAP 1560/4]